MPDSVAWHPHPEVWALVLFLLGGYFYGLNRFRPEHEEAWPSRKIFWFLVGVGSIWFVLEYPMHELAETFLYSAHTVQHVVLSLVAPPLLMIGTPPWLLRRLLGAGTRLRIARLITRPVPALILFNAVIALIHWPALVNAMSINVPLHVGVHWLVLGSALVMWTPVLSPLLELPQLSYPGRMFYLFLQSLVPTIPASFLTFASRPIYSVYSSGPGAFGLSSLDDLQIAGLIMKIGGGFILWSLITVLFFKWYALEQSEDVDVMAWRDVDRELNRVELDS